MPYSQIYIHVFRQTYIDYAVLSHIEISRLLEYAYIEDYFLSLYSVLKAGRVFYNRKHGDCVFY